jgi:hypothetical protein
MRNGSAVVFWLMFTVQLICLLYGVLLLKTIHKAQTKANQAFLDYFERIKKSENRLEKLEVTSGDSKNNY